MKKGFTLMEILLSVVIASTVILMASAMYFILLSTRIKNQTISETEAQASAAMQLILQTVRNSVSITTPVAGTSAPSLTVAVVDPAKNPTVFDISGGILRIKEGSQSAIPLTNTRVTVSSLLFQNLSATGSAGTVRAQFSVAAVNNSGRNEYDYSVSATGSASLRF